MTNHMPSIVLDEIIYQFPKFNGGTIEVRDWKSNIVQYLQLM